MAVILLKNHDIIRRLKFIFAEHVETLIYHNVKKKKGKISIRQIEN